jgi:Xaa-Pro aminopeptidase
MDTVPSTELSGRIRRLQRRLREADDAEAVIVLQDIDLFYFSGTAQDAWMVIPTDGPPVLLVRRDLARARQESALERIVPFSSGREIPTLLAEHGLGRLRRVGLEFDVLPVELYARIGRIFPTMQLVDASPLIRQVRMVKSPYEVERIRSAACIADQMARRMREVLRPGIRELELAAEIEAEARRRGHQGLVRARRFNQAFHYGHLLSGENGAVPSAQESATGGTGLSPAFGNSAGSRRIQAHEPVVLDYVGVHQGYHADQTRLFTIGALPPDMAQALQVCVEILEDALIHLRPGIRAGEVYDRAVALADRRGYADRFMNTGAAQVSFVGHGVGLELDEIPVLARQSDLVLEPGMTLAIEPKIVFPGRGVVGIEDTVLVTTGPPECLTFTPRELVVL